jgi:hypothetical protein
MGEEGLERVCQWQTPDPKPESCLWQVAGLSETKRQVPSFAPNKNPCESRGFCLGEERLERVCQWQTPDPKPESCQWQVAGLSETKRQVPSFAPNKNPCVSRGFYYGVMVV